MHFTALLLSAALLVSSVDARFGSASFHGSSRRSSLHRDAAKRLPKDTELYAAAAHQARGENPNPKPLRKRAATGCSVNSTSTSTASWASASASPSASASASASSWSNATTSMVNVGAAVSTASAPAATSTSSSPWNMVRQASGATFFDDWNVWSYPDPTHGTVDYVNTGDAWNQGLMSINSAGNPVLKVDATKNVQGGRKSVRLHSKYTFNGGLIIFDALHMPTGCGTWPAFWSNGPNWPYGGEIDILEGVNNFSQNQVSIHTGGGCTLPGNVVTTQVADLITSSNYDAFNCDSYATGNQGCGTRTSAPNTYGAPFNTNGGGVYAMKWDNSGISVYFFPRGQIPNDINSDQPDHTTWGLPMANYPSTNCNPWQFFKDHFAIINTTFCGDWAGSTWNQAGWAGQSTSCAASTGYSTCADYVLNNGDKFDQAYWEIKSIKYFQPK